MTIKKKNICVSEKAHKDVSMESSRSGRQKGEIASEALVIGVKMIRAKRLNKQ